MRPTIYNARDGVRWALFSTNGKLTAESGEAYVKRATAVAGLRRAVVLGAKYFGLDSPWALNNRWQRWQAEAEVRAGKIREARVILDSMVQNYERTGCITVQNIDAAKAFLKGTW